MVYCSILGRCSKDLYWFSTTEKNCFRNLDRTAHIGTIVSSSEFNQKPAVILLLVAKVVAFLESLRICVFNTLHYFLYATLKFHTFLLFHFLSMFVHSAVEFFHLFVTVDLLFHEFFLSCFEFHNILYMRVQAISFDNIKLFLTDFAFAAKFMSFDQKVGQIVAPLRAILSTLSEFVLKCRHRDFVVSKTWH